MKKPRYHLNFPFGTLIASVTGGPAIPYSAFRNEAPGRLSTHTGDISHQPMPLCRLVCKMGVLTAMRDFFAEHGDLTQEYFVYFKSNQHSAAEKDPSSGCAIHFSSKALPRRSVYSFPSKPFTTNHYRKGRGVCQEISLNSKASRIFRISSAPPSTVLSPPTATQ